MTLSQDERRELDLLRMRISELEALKTSLQQAKDQLQQYVHNAPVGIFVVNEAAEYIDANPVACEMVGYTLEELKTLTIRDLVPQRGEEITLQGFQQLIQNGQIQQELQLRRKDGGVIDVELNAVEIPNRQYMAFCTDITSKKRTEIELKQSEARFFGAFHYAPIGMALVHPDGRWLQVNPALCRLLGYDEEELLTKTFQELTNREDRDGHITQVQEFLDKDQDTTALDTRYIHKTGRLLEVQIHASVVRNEEGIPQYLIFQIQDTTDRKQSERERRKLEAKVRHAQKLESLGVMAGGIAHDFNNLLVGILGNAGLALMDLPTEAPARESILQIETAALRAADLTKQMLAYSGKGKFVIEVLDLETLIKEMIHLLKISISKNAVIKFEFSPNVPKIQGDATQIRQVIMNLVVNASEAIGDRSGVIAIRTGAMDCDRAYLTELYLDRTLPEGVYSYIEVSDTGIGMDEETKARIFDPFFTTKFTGRGLGLAATLGIIRCHNGAIKVYSEPQKGTTFKVLFPAYQADTPVETNTKLHIKETPLTGARILLVDDDETVRAVGRSMLERLGLEVSVAVDGRDALQIFKADEQGFDFVLLDLTMPHLDGEETFRELRRIKKDVCVILSSGYNEQDLINRFAGKGLAGFIQKPYSPTKLKEVLLSSRRL